jgi:hypothetical protein
LVKVDALLEAAADLAHLVEADIPASPASDKNAQHERQYAAIFADYFKKLEQAFPYDSLANLYYKHITMESGRLREADPTSEFGGLLDPILKAFRARILADLIGQHVAIYLAGSAEITIWGKTKAGIPIAFEGPPIQDAISYAREHCAELVTKMDEESRRLIAQTVSDGIKNKRGIDGLARDIRKQFDDMSRYRSKMIARTETADALSQGAIDRMTAMGVTGKESIRGSNEDCDICQGNEDAGILPIDQPFPSGHMRVPYHPNCVCAVAPVMLTASV